MKIKATVDGGRHVQMKDADTRGIWSDSSYPIFAPSVAISDGPQRNNPFAVDGMNVQSGDLVYDPATLDKLQEQLRNTMKLFAVPSFVIEKLEFGDVTATPTVIPWDTTSPIPFPGLPAIPPAALPQDDLLGPDNPGHRGVRDVLRHLQEGKTLSPAARTALRGALDAAEAPLKGRAKSDDAVRRILR